MYIALLTPKVWGVSFLIGEGAINSDGKTACQIPARYVQVKVDKIYLKKV